MFESLFPVSPIVVWGSVIVLVMLCCIFAACSYSYTNHRIRAVLKDEGSVADLAAQVEQLRSDKDALTAWLEQNKEQMQMIDGERRQQESLRSELADLERDCLERENHQREMLTSLAEIEAKQNVLRENSTALEARCHDAEARRDAVSGEIEEINKQIAALREEKAAAEKEVAELGAQKQVVLELSEKKESLLRGIDSLERDKAALAQEKQALQNELENASPRLEKFRSELEEQRAALHQAKGEHTQLVQATQDTNIAYTTLRAEYARLEDRIQQLKEEKAALDGKSDSVTAPAESCADLFIAPESLQQKAFTASAGDLSETRALSGFRHFLEEQGIMFSGRTINAFHTALKCQSINPLTVLAGVSGTGKTLLPVKYAEFMGIHTLILPVQPRWDSPQDLFGFYNYLEKKYKATELSRCLVYMDPYNCKALHSAWAHERMLLVLLDEMNLARTEYYFSEFLSKLELRRQVGDCTQLSQRHKAEVTLDTGSAGKPLSLWIPGNVLFVGTMNEDESTQTLSDKVLDRANVLRFGRPPEVPVQTVAPRSLSTTSEFLPFTLWESWQSDISQQDSRYADCAEWLKKINDALDAIGRPFGYRVREAILQYVANYPEKENYKLAFADQIEQKILPKLRGIDLEDSQMGVCLNTIGDVLSRLGDKELGDAFAAARAEGERLGMFTWRGVTRKPE